MANPDSNLPPELPPGSDIRRNPQRRGPESTLGQFANPRQAGLIKPQVKLAETSGDGMPAGASLHPPTPSPLPYRGAGMFFFINLAAALVAVIFTFLIALRF